MADFIKLCLLIWTTSAFCKASHVRTTKPVVCQDAMSICHQWPKSDCQNELWREQVCPRHCGTCKDDRTTVAPPTTPTKTTTPTTTRTTTTSTSTTTSTTTSPWVPIKRMEYDHCRCGLRNTGSGNNRIFGGVETDPREFGWLVYLLISGIDWHAPGSKCTGSLIGDQWILTAAHCMFYFRTRTPVRPTDIKVHIGRHNVMKRRSEGEIIAGVARYRNHPQYNYRNLDLDFSIIKLERKIDFKAYPHIRPICLPNNPQNFYTGEIATTAGWGDNGNIPNTAKPRKADTKIMDNNKCSSMTPNRTEMTKNKLCTYAEDKDACGGDSGGPTMTTSGGDGVTPGENYELVGVVSYGWNCTLGHPGINARVTSALDWITATTEGELGTCARQ